MFMKLQNFIKLRAEVHELLC